MCRPIGKLARISESMLRACYVPRLLARSCGGLRTCAYGNLNTEDRSLPPDGGRKGLLLVVVKRTLQVGRARAHEPLA